MSRRLAVWLYDVRVADLEARGTDIRLRYTNAALEMWPANTAVVSCSMLVSRAWHPARVFLRGLLPEGDHLRQVAAVANVAASDTFALLARYGRDVAGALVITPHDQAPDESRWEAIPYTPAGLAADVVAVDENSTAWIHDDSELSLAGIQNKLLLISDGTGGWARPAGGRPSTHVLKIDDAARPGLVAAEYHALRLAQSVGLSNLEPELAAIGDRVCLIVRRFDRIIDQGSVQRVHQEDACQALRIDQDANGGRGKYEDSGGPSLRDVAGLLRRYGRDPIEELAALFRLTVLNVVVGNADAHGKNISVLLNRDGHIKVTPAYDIVPTVLWPRLRRHPAMAVNGCADITSISFDDLVAEGARWGLERNRCGRLIGDLSGLIAEVTIEHSPLAHHVRTMLDHLARPSA